MAELKRRTDRIAIDREETRLDMTLKEKREREGESVVCTLTTSN
jgi:hypothetical protein